MKRFHSRPIATTVCSALVPLVLLGQHALANVHGVEQLLIVPGDSPAIYDLEQIENEVEGTIREDEELDGNGRACLIFGAIVELLDELADRHTVLTERRPDGRRRSRLATGNLKLDLRCDFFLRRHGQLALVVPSPNPIGALSKLCWLG